jgi:hypothetical protein
MKNKPFDYRSPYSLKKRRKGREPDDSLELVKPEPKWGTSGDVLENIKRWDEEGGNFIEVDPSTLDLKRRNTMKKRAGLWLDRNKAVIVSIANNIEARRIITSDMEHYALYSTVVPGDGSPEDVRDRRFWNHLDEYYDKIVADIRDAAEIQIFGPGEAKNELQNRLEDNGLSGHIVSIENAETLTNVQIATRVQKRFPARSQYDIF